MKRISKRLLSLVLALMMVATLLPMGAIQAFADDITWTEVGTYEELTAALANGGNIKLTADITATAQTTISKPTTLDFNGNTLTLYGGYKWPFYLSGKDIVLQDTSAEANGGAYLSPELADAYQMLRISGTATIKGGVYTLEDNKSTVTNAIYCWGTVTVEGGTFNITGNTVSTIRGAYTTATGKMYMNGGTFNVANTANGKAYGFHTDSTAESVINGSTVNVTTKGTGIAYGLSQEKNTGTMTVKSGSITANTEGSASAYGHYQVSAAGVICVEGGTITANAKGTGLAYGLCAYSTSNQAVIRGGTINANTIDNSSTAVSVANNANAKLLVPEDAGAAFINAYSKNYSAYGINNYGVAELYSDKLSVTSTSDFVATSGSTARYAYTVQNARQITITAGTYKGYSGNTDSTKTHAYGYANGRVSESIVGTGTISGGTFEGYASGTRGIGILCNYADDLTITGDTVAHGQGKGLWVYRGTVTVSGGTFISDYSTYNIHIDTAADVDITGGTFEVNGTGKIRNSGTLDITGGTFKATDNVITNTGTLAITGGTFTGSTGEGWLDIYAHLNTENYSQDDNGKVVAADTVDPRFEVTIGDAVTQYESLNEMIAAVNATTGNAKIKLLRDLNLGDSRSFTTSIDLDLNDHVWLQSSYTAIDVTGLGTENQITKIHNGTVIHKGSSVPIAVHKGAIQLEDLTVYGCSTMPVCYYAPTGDYAANSYIKNCNLITNRYYVFSYRTSSAAGQQNMDILIEDTNLINLYTQSGGGEIFYAGSAATTGQYTLGKNVNMYQVYNGNLASQSGNTVNVKPVAEEGCTIHDKAEAASYSNINAILSSVGNAAGFTEGQYVYKQESVWTTNPTLYKVSTEHTFNDGACACGESTVASIGDVKYTDLATALEEVADGQTVTLLGNVITNADLIVGNQTTLDLNGKTLEAGSLAVYGDLVDGDIGGNAVVKSANFHNKSTKFLPIYDTTAGGYRFYSYDLNELGYKSVNDTTIKFGFRLLLDNEYGYTLLTDAENSKLSAKINITLSGDYNTTMVYNLKSSTLAAYGQAQKEGKTTWAIQLTVTGIDKLGANGAITMAPAFDSTVGTAISGNGSQWSATTA